jgi:c-di-GMP-binding flagellar brake protein YcgR
MFANHKHPTTDVTDSEVKSYSDTSETQVTINDTLQVRMMGEKNPITHYSRINDITEGKLVISWPTNRGVRLMAHPDHMLDFFFVRDGIIYGFSGLVDETNLDAVPTITIIVSSAITQVQRRQNFRIKCLIPVELIGNIKENPRDDSVTFLDVKTTSYDLSAGGISIRHAKRIPAESLLTVKISLPDNGTAIDIPGSVIYSEYLSENKILHHTGIRYLYISEKDRARIVRFVYRKQLQGLRT